MASRSGTIDGVKRPCRRIVTKVEKVFQNNCYDVERSDSLWQIMITRTQQVHRSDGTFSVHIHEDCYCVEIHGSITPIPGLKTKCRHRVLHTEYEEKLVIYGACPHSKQGIREPNVTLNFREDVFFNVIINYFVFF